MKKALPLITLCVAFIATCQPAIAGKVSIAAAQTAAINFYRLSAKNTAGKTAFTATLKYTQTEPDNTVDFYVFNICPGKGFVMVAADDRVSPVIAYSTESDFNIPAKGSGVQCWMNHAAAHIHRAVQRNIVASQTISGQWNAYLQGQKPPGAKDVATGVAPLLSTNWNQEPYYNQLCPYNTTDSMNAVTGCVATAMAQIMKYWNYPVQGTGQYGYADAPPYCSNNYGNQFANFGATTYNWAAMPDTLSSNNTAVATLMYQCGVAVAMDYGDDNQGGSGAYVLASDVASWKHTAQMAYTTYFSYNQHTLQGVRESDYNAADWLSLIESELNAGRPVQYVGTDTTAGSHTWVCDGYDVNGLLHMNWGWGGFDNGYYNSSSLTGDGYNFSSNEEALIGIEPANDLSVTATVANAAICNGSSTLLTAQGGPAGANYTWIPATGLSCPTCAGTLASPLATTVYTVTMDSAGLSAIASVTVTVNNKMNVESTEVTDATCFGLSNGTAKIEISGGTAGYRYIWSNGNDSAAISGLGAGNYGVTVTDAKSCTVSAATSILQPAALSATISASNNACSLTNALLTVAAQGGTPAYSFIWDNGQTALSVYSPEAGNYTVTVADANGCSASATLAVVQPPVMDVNIVSSNTTCSLLYATASVNVTGGNPDFSYAWSNGESTSAITNLTAGSLSVTVTDNAGCSAAASKNFTEPDAMSVSIITSEITDTKVYVNAVVNVTGGTPEYSYLWNTGASTPEISDLTAGNYTVTITDNKGCTQTAATQISGTTGISNASKNIAFEVYPNPATNFATLALDDDYKNTTMEVKNLLGQTLLTGIISGKETRLNLTDFASGIYLISITSGGNTGLKEIAIQK